MPQPSISPTHKAIKSYYAKLKADDSIGAEHEGAVRTAFQNLLQHYCRQADLILVCEKTHYTSHSTLEWIINQYCVKIDKRSGIVNDPNRADDPQYIVKLIGKVIGVSLETVDIVENLPALQ